MKTCQEIEIQHRIILYLLDAEISARASTTRLDIEANLIHAATIKVTELTVDRCSVWESEFWTKLEEILSNLEGNLSAKLGILEWMNRKRRKVRTTHLPYWLFLILTPVEWIYAEWFNVPEA